MWVAVRQLGAFVRGAGANARSHSRFVVASDLVRWRVSAARRRAATARVSDRRPAQLARSMGVGLRLALGAVLSAVLVPSAACTTVDAGQDFQIADIVFDEDYYYCEVEPVLFKNGCGPGSGSDAAGGCHFNVTNFRLRDYSPLVGESCQNGAPGVTPNNTARDNYQAAQTQMRRDPDLAPLFNRPTGTTAHPRQIFPADSPDAQVIRDWAERFSSQ